MAWEHIAAAVGGGANMALNTLLQMEDQKIKREAIDADTKQSQLANEIKLALQELKGRQATDLETLRQRGRETLAALVASGRIDVQRLQNEGHAYVQQLRNEGALDEEELRAIGRLNLQKEINEGLKGVQELRNSGAANVANINAANDVDVANIQGATARDTAGMRVDEAGRQFDLSFPLDVFQANTGRIRARRPASSLFGDVSLPSVDGGAPATAPVNPNDTFVPPVIPPRPPRTLPAAVEDLNQAVSRPIPGSGGAVQKSAVPVRPRVTADSVLPPHLRSTPAPATASSPDAAAVQRNTLAATAKGVLAKFRATKDPAEKARLYDELVKLRAQLAGK